MPLTPQEKADLIQELEQLISKPLYEHLIKHPQRSMLLEALIYDTQGYFLSKQDDQLIRQLYLFDEDPDVRKTARLVFALRVMQHTGSYDEWTRWKNSVNQYRLDACNSAFQEFPRFFTKTLEYNWLLAYGLIFQALPVKEYFIGNVSYLY